MQPTVDVYIYCIYISHESKSVFFHTKYDLDILFSSQEIEEMEVMEKRRELHLGGLNVPCQLVGWFKKERLCHYHSLVTVIPSINIHIHSSRGTRYNLPLNTHQRKFVATCFKERPHAPQPVELSQSHQCRERFEQRGTQAEHHEVDRTQGVTCWRTNIKLHFGNLL